MGFKNGIEETAGTGAITVPFLCSNPRRIVTFERTRQVY
jgi:hypothetical protein